MVYEPIASGKRCWFLNATLTLFSLYCRPKWCIRTATVTQPLVGCGVLSCRGVSAYVKGCREEAAQPRLGKAGDTRSSLASVTRSSSGFVSHLQKSISEESHEVIVCLIFCTRRINFLCCLCTRNKQFEAENVLISQQYVNIRAGRQVVCSTSHGGGGSPAKPARDVPCLSWEHWRLKEILLYLNSSSSYLTTEGQGCELVASALEEDFFCVLCQ